LPKGISARPLACRSRSGEVCAVMAFYPSTRVTRIIESGPVGATKLDFKAQSAWGRGRTS
jgi:hypothetical protein